MSDGETTAYDECRLPSHKRVPLNSSHARGATLNCFSRCCPGRCLLPSLQPLLPAPPAAQAPPGQWALPASTTPYSSTVATPTPNSVHADLLGAINASASVSLASAQSGSVHADLPVTCSPVERRSLYVTPVSYFRLCASSSLRRLDAHRSDTTWYTPQCGHKLVSAQRIPKPSRPRPDAVFRTCRSNLRVETVTRKRSTSVTSRSTI